MSHETPDFDDAEIRRMDSLNMTDGGRVTIPSAVRNHFGIEAGDLLALRLCLDDGSTETFQSRVVGRGKVRIPERLREKHGLTDENDADLELAI